MSKFEQRSRRKLTDEQVIEMRGKYTSTEHLHHLDKDKWTYTKLQKHFKVSHDTIWKILTYRRFRNLP